MSGHSKWANIKHRKGRQDARRAKVWSKCSKAIMAAARTGGGDPDMNVTLRYAIDDARAENMPKDTIANAIKKGTGELQGAASLEEIRYEGYGPNGVAVMLDILTDNRNRTAPEIKKLFERSGGNLGATGCVAYVFESKGQVFVPRNAADEERITEAALEAGADDVQDGGDSWEILCDPNDCFAVKEALEASGLPVESAGITMLPKNTVPCSGDIVPRILALIEALEDHDDVQKVYANFDIPDEELAKLE